MGKIYKSVTELVGRTPLLEVQNIEEQLQLGAKVLVKLEYFNPAGSVKDRVALNMLEEAERQGKIKPGATIIEPTSGNTGIGLASIAVAKGYKAVFVMPETMSIESKKTASWIWCGNCIDGGRERDERRDRACGRASAGEGKCDRPWTVCESGEPKGT